MRKTVEEMAQALEGKLSEVERILEWKRERQVVEWSLSIIESDVALARDALEKKDEKLMQHALRNLELY